MMDEMTEVRVQLVQNYVTESCEDTKELMFESLDDLKTEISEFILENQSTIKSIYDTLKEKGIRANQIILEMVADTDKVFHAYEDYHDAMLGYIRDCMAKGVTDDGIGMAIESIQKKDRMFLENELEYVTECAPDAMRNVETIADLSQLVDRIKKEGEGILSLPGEASTKEELYTMYTKSTLTFCIKLLALIKDVFGQVSQGVLHPVDKKKGVEDYVFF